MVRGTFSPARAWRPAVVARLARTLGLACPPLWPPHRCLKFRRARSAGTVFSWLSGCSFGAWTLAKNSVLLYWVCGLEYSEPRGLALHSAAASTGAASQVFQGLPRPAAFGHSSACACGACQRSTVQGLTPRSSGAPTAYHQAREAGTVYIFFIAGLAACRWLPRSSNGRRHRSIALCPPKFNAAQSPV